MEYYRVFFNRYSNFTTYQFNQKDVVLRLGCVQEKLVGEVIQVYTINKELLYSSHMKKSEYIKCADFVKKIVGMPIKYYFVIEDSQENDIGEISFNDVHGDGCYTMVLNSEKYIAYNEDDYIYVKLNGKTIATILYTDTDEYPCYSLECEGKNYIEQLFLLIMYYDLNRKNILAHIKEKVSSIDVIPKPIKNISDKICMTNESKE